MTPYRIGLVCLIGFIAFSLSAKPIRLRTGTIDPRQQRAQAQALEPRGQPETGLYLVQLRDELPADWRAQVRALDAQLLRFVPEDAFVARIPGDAVGRIRLLPFVEWVGEYLPEHKVHPQLAAAGLQLNNVSILLSRAATPMEVNGSRAVFATLRQHSALPFGSVLRGNVTAARLAELARSSAVVWIEPGPNFKLVDETAAKIVGGDAGPGQTVTHALGFDGRGVTVAVPDSGLHNGDAASMHTDLFGRVTAFFHYGTLTDAADEHSHGTHVAGIIAGNGAMGEVDELGELYGLGVAPQARIIAQRIFDGVGNYEAPPSFERLTRDAVRAGADIGSNSWGDDTQGRYDTAAMEFDALVRDADALAPGAQEFILEFSAGNAGPGPQTIGSPAVAKNVIATGASQNNRFEFILYSEGQDAMADFSSRGPCEDGRIKPDVVAPGTWIASLQSASAGDENAWATISPNYLYQGGTSQAGPQVSGAAAVLVQYLREVYSMPRPSPALIKAALINSAVDMDDFSGTTPIPNSDEGWGRVDLTEIIASSRAYEFVDQTQLLTANQTFEQRVVAATSFEPLRITLAYTDYPGFPGAVPALVNDLDLEVIAPDGTIYRGNQLSDGEAIPNAGAHDPINNVEAVYLAEPAPGEYIIRVHARRVVEDSRVETAPVDQDFALVISADIPMPGTGLVLLDRRAYTAPSRIKVSVIDSDLAGQSTVNVQVRSTTESAGKTLQLRASNSSGTFTGSVATVTGSAAGAGQLQINHNDVIEAIYQDDGVGPRTASARADLLAPVLSNVNSTNLFGRRIVRWLSDEPANSIVRYGTNASLPLSSTNHFLTQDHTVSLNNLIAGQTYFFVVISVDEAGNRATNDNAGALFSFVAGRPSPVLLVDAYEADSESTPVPRSGYTDALDQTGIEYEVWDVLERGAPQLNDLRPHQVVMWRITDSPYVQTSTLSAQDQANIQAYLAGGGAFFMSSMEILSRLGDVPFRRNVFRVEQFLPNPSPFEQCTDCDEDFGVPTIRGRANDPTAREVLVDLDYSAYPFIDFGFFQLGPDFSDTFTPSTNATPVILEHFSSKPCGMKFPRAGQDSAGRVVFLSFPIDTIPETGPSPNNRGAVLRNILQFLAPGYGGFGTLVMDRAEYTLPDVITFEVADSDLAGAGQTSIECYSQSFGERIPVVLTETARAGLFRGAVTLAPGSDPGGPGKVRAQSGDLLFAEYVDASGGVTVQASARVDTITPQIANAGIEPDYESAIVFWDTTEPADTLVQYGESELLGRAEYSGELSDYHEIRLSGLIPDRLYYYKIVSRDMAGNTVEDDNNGQLYTFRTLRPIIPPWYDNLESGATNWITFDAEDTQSTWTLGVPNNNWETDAVSPINAWGSSLNGAVLDYAETFLISPAIDLTGGNDATLRFFHSYDFTLQTELDLTEGGRLLIVTNSVTAPVELRTYGPDDVLHWEEEIVDLTPYAGRVVFLIWKYELLSFDSLPRAGWLLDDVSVTLATVSPGTIRVTNNLAQARFTLTGRGVSRPGQGISTVFSNLPPGEYTIAWTDVPFYATPLELAEDLLSGSALVFNGLYTFPDTNNNGMSDLWEDQFFGIVAPERTRDTDTDGDGSTDHDEFNAGTNPNTPSSYLRLVRPTILPGNVVRIQWTSAPGRIYRVEGSANAIDWSPITDWLPASSVNTSVTIPMGARFLFRVEVRP